MRKEDKGGLTSQPQVARVPAPATREASPSAADLWKLPRPDYCPDDLSEDEICPACGADPRPAVPHNYCRARHNGPRPRSLVQIILTHKATGEPI